MVDTRLITDWATLLVVVTSVFASAWFGTWLPCGQWGPRVMFLAAASVAIEYLRVAVAYILERPDWGYGSWPGLITRLVVAVFWTWIVYLIISNKFLKSNHKGKGASEHD